MSPNTFFDTMPTPNASADVPEPIRRRIRQLLADLVGIHRFQIEAVNADFETTQRLLQRFSERVTNRP